MLYEKRTEYIAIIVLFSSLFAYVARDPQEYQDVVFRGVVIGIKSTNCKKTPASMQINRKSLKVFLEFWKREGIPIDFISV